MIPSRRMESVVERRARMILQVNLVRDLFSGHFTSDSTKCPRQLQLRDLFENKRLTICRNANLNI